jgi:hypothetical protein
MEIIEVGKLPEEQLFTGTCTHCRCRVRFKRAEAKYHSSPKNESHLSVKCPTPKCPKDIFVEI